MSNAPRDGNRVPSLIGESNAGDRAPVIIYADPATQRLLVNATITGSITVDSITGAVEITNDAGNPIPVNGTVTANAGTGTFTVDGSGVTQPVSGTVTANLSATDNTVLDNIDANTAPTTGLNTGRKTVTTAGTAEAIAASTTCKWVQITAETDNTGIVVVGDSGVIASLSTREGTPLNAGDTVTIPIDNLADVYIDSTVNGEGVSFLYGT